MPGAMSGAMSEGWIEAGGLVRYVKSKEQCQEQCQRGGLKWVSW
jgi:hypothetical protein